MVSSEFIESNENNSSSLTKKTERDLDSETFEEFHLKLNWNY